jgi:poly(3-hydroxybutyrate) depolymerase
LKAFRATRKKVQLGSAGVVCLASLTIVLPHRLASGETAAGTISGASQAICTPAPCAPSSSTAAYALASVSNGDGTESTRAYAVYRPANLIPSQTNRAPAVLVFYQSGNCGLKPSGRFASLAPSGRFIVVYMEVPCGRDDNWDKRNVDPETITAVNDEPYVTAVVAAITQCPSSGAGQNQCVDPQRIYAVGTSSGGNMTADVMCDAENSSLFRGYLIDSSSLQLFGGAPACPSTNRDFFVMMVLGNYGSDSGLYYDKAPNLHLDVPAFADWAARRLGCESRRVEDAIGSPEASTLRYAYSGPCAFAAAGSQAVVALGAQNGSHTWSCQDSDAGAQPNGCPNMPTPPGLTPNGLPDTNGLFVEEDFWSFVSQGVSSSAPTPAPTPAPNETVTPLLGGAGGGSLIAKDDNVPGYSPPAFVALGDAYAAGAGNPPYLPGTDTARDRCRRSTGSYPLIASTALSGGPSGLIFRACSGAQIADFYGASRRNREPPQLRWLDGATRLVSLSVGWGDALLPQALRSCTLDSSRCKARWRARTEAAIRAIGAHSPGSRGSLYALYERIDSLAPRARVVVFGYPRLFPAAPPPRCDTGVRSLGFTRGAMEWIDAEIQRLDGAIESAAAAAHIRYVRDSYTAFRGHEICTRQPDLHGAIPNAAIGAHRLHGTLGAGFSPNRRGETLLAKLLERSL